VDGGWRRVSLGFVGFRDGEDEQTCAFGAVSSWIAVIELVRLDAGDRWWREFSMMQGAMAQEALPGEAPIPLSELHASIVHAPAHRQTLSLVAVDGDQPVGAVMLVVDDVQGRQHGWLRLLYVTPRHRRRGIGSRLLAATRDKARSTGRSRLQVWSLAADRAAEGFAHRHNGQKALEVEQNRCLTAELDRALLGGWVERAGERAGDYTLVAFDGVCPHEHLDAFAAVIPVMNTAPRAAGISDVAPSPDEVRESMAAHVRQGHIPWTVCAQHLPSGTFVGYSELSLSTHRRWHATQGDTGVHPDHRNKGIGRWLKAHNALRLLDGQPGVEHIETLNAGTNEAMLTINRAMGFRPVARWQEWNLPT
jgi:mycothiol synthase